MSRRRQKGKHMKRLKSWHRGGVESKAWNRAIARWPEPAPADSAPVDQIAIRP